VAAVPVISANISPIIAMGFIWDSRLAVETPGMFRKFLANYGKNNKFIYNNGLQKLVLATHSQYFQNCESPISRCLILKSAVIK
jgi:hypothetical protein